MPRRSGGRWLLLLLAAAVAAAAAAHGGGGADGDAEAAAERENKHRSKHVALGVCGGGPDALRVLRTTAWPGGAQVAVGVGWGRLGASASDDSSDLPAANVTLADLPGWRIRSTTVAPVAAHDGLTAIALQTAPPAQLGALLDAAQALAEALPPRERIAVYAVGAGAPTLVCDFTDSRQHIITRLAELRRAGGNASAPADLDAAAFTDMLAGVTAPARFAEGPLHRTLVVVAPRPQPLAPAAGRVDAWPVAVGAVLWLSPGAAPGFDAAAGAAGWSPADGQAGAIAAARALAAAVAAQRAASFRVGLCLEPDGGSDSGGTPAALGNATLTLSVVSAGGGAPQTCVVRGPDVAPVAHEGAAAAAACDAEDAAADAYPYFDTLILSMDAAEAAVFERNRAFYKGDDDQAEASKGGMRMRVLFGAGGVPVDADAHFRGVSSFRDCARRKSLSVSLAGPRGRRLLRGASAASTKLLLISMCSDDHYLKQRIANAAGAALGLFDVASRYVRLLVRTPGGEENVGVYLMMAQPESVYAEDAGAATDAVVRRRNDPERATDPAKGTPDVRLPADSARAPLEHTPPAAAALARYDALAATGDACDGGGGACYAALAAQMNFDQYLRHAALMSLTANGDHIDEMWFWSPAEGPSGAYWWSLNQWDTDDSFDGSCHHDGLDAAFDPAGLLFCTEADLDRVLYRSPDAYARFADVLEWMARRGLPPAAVAGIAQRALAEILGLLQDDATALAMSELRESDPGNLTTGAAVRASIRDGAAYYTFAFEQRRAEVLHQLRIYRTRYDRPPAPVVVVAGTGDVTPGALLLPAGGTPPEPRAPRPRALNAARAGDALVPLCDALAAGTLTLGMRTQLFNYTSDVAPQELALAPVVRYGGVRGTAVQLRGLRLGVSFDRMALDVYAADAGAGSDESDQGAATTAAGVPYQADAPEFIAVCLSGGAPAGVNGTAVAQGDACRDYDVHVSVEAAAIVIELRNGTLCAGCQLDLGVDDALAAVWHWRWLPLTGAAAVTPLLPRSCDDAALPAVSMNTTTAPELPPIVIAGGQKVVAVAQPTAAAAGAPPYAESPAAAWDEWPAPPLQLAAASAPTGAIAPAAAAPPPAQLAPQPPASPPPRPPPDSLVSVTRPVATPAPALRTGAGPPPEQPPRVSVVPPALRGAGTSLLCGLRLVAGGACG